MGVLSKLTSTASNTITIGTVLAKTASIAALTALDTSLQTTKLFSDYAFGCAEDFVKVAEEVLETSGTVADHIANVAFVTLIMGAKLMPRQIAEAVKMLKILDDEIVDKFEEVVSSIVTIIETGDLQGLEETIGDILEAGLFGVTALQPNLLLALFIIMQIIVTGSQTLVSKGMIEEEDASEYSRNICAKIWRTYGEVYHGQEWIGFDNIPDDGALIIYYHGVVPVDYFGLVGEIWLRKGKVVSSVVDRSLMEIPYMDPLREAFNLFPGTVDSCSDLLRSGELLGIAPGGAYESLFGDANYPVLWNSRVGFAKVAINANKPIIPVFTENIRENTLSLAGRMTTGRKMWESLYKSTKMPVVPMYGLFPVKLRTHIGSPIYPTPGMTPEELSKQTSEAIQLLINNHQVLPGNLTQALAARMDDPMSKLSRSPSHVSLLSSEGRMTPSASTSSLAPSVVSDQDTEPECQERSDMKEVIRKIPIFKITDEDSTEVEREE